MLRCITVVIHNAGHENTALLYRWQMRCTAGNDHDGSCDADL
ncbi:predicted protein [Streptomyces iranensis]|uniref:Uncharacterized protein n=1 Tax=Streptomyces iranensis TaxID=576784 RepID=A0A060ZH98_9ACTN|nr:predicted protein [Streptomyces iranensis]